MKKKIVLLFAMLTVSASVIVGCSKETGQGDPGTSESIMQSEEASEVIGTVDEIKDFMIT